MRRNLFTLSMLLVFAGGAWADEKDEKYAKPGAQAGPPPGKGWRKNETPTPAVPEVKPTAPVPKAKVETPPAPKAKAPVPTPPKEEGIGQQVSAWARSGIHGPQLAAKIHELQATMAKKDVPPPTVKPAKPEVTPPTPPTPKKGPKKGGGEED